jgi:hypothetical protein
VTTRVCSCGTNVTSDVAESLFSAGERSASIL